MFLKMLRPVICFVLIAVMMVMLPVQALAEEPTVSELKAELASMYRQTLRATEKESLDGLCATLVAWELYISGINRIFVAGDGKDQYDNYCDKEMTSGGYYIHALSAEDYSLEEALLEITDNGSRNVYNILIGFEKTNTPAGSIFGHTIFIGGIVDGMVYYVESNPYMINGVYHAEGTPIGISISGFADKYDDWTTFEGAIVFEKERYVDACEEYPTDLFVQTTQNMTVWTEPCADGQSAWSEPVRQVRSGEVFRVDGLYLNPDGEYWYRVADVEDRFLPAADTHMLHANFDRVTVSDVRAPGILEVGDSVRLDGTVTSCGSQIHTVRCQIYTGTAGSGVLTDNAMEHVEGLSCRISDSDIPGQLSFRTLKAGDYHYVISAAVCDYYLDGGELRQRWTRKNLWTGDFRVAEDADLVTAQVITMDPNGGSAGVNQAVLEKGTLMSGALTPERAGYRFAGWYETVNGRARGPHLYSRSEGEIYAKWRPAEDTLDGWNLVDGTWRLYEDGRMVTGTVTWDGIDYYFNDDGSLYTGWRLTMDKVNYYYENGAAATGRVIIDGIEYLFDEHGAVLPEWLLF